MSNRGRRKNLKELTLKCNIVFDFYNTGVTTGKKKQPKILKSICDFLCKHRNFLTNPLSQVISPFSLIALTTKLPTKINNFYKILCTKSCSPCSSKKILLTAVEIAFEQGFDQTFHILECCKWSSGKLYQAGENLHLTPVLL